MKSSLLAAVAAILLLAACVSDGAPAPEPISRYEGLTCAPFEWAAAEGISDRAGIMLHATVNGRPTTLQLDTGADANILDGPVAGWGLTGDERGWSEASLRVGDIDLGRSPVLGRGNAGDELSGTLGLAGLHNHIVVINYPAQRFCVAQSASAPLLQTADFIDARVTAGKFWIPVTANGARYENFFFDTGASIFPLSVDLDLWRTLTGDDPEHADHVVDVPSWGRTIQLRGSEPIGAVSVGGTSFEEPLVYYTSSAPTFFADWRFPFPVHGLVGNAPFFERVVVIDLREGTYRFGVAGPAG